jgi:integrase
MAEGPKRRPKGTYGVNRRGNKFEAVYNIPKSELPPGSPRKAITKQGDTEQKAVAALMSHLRTMGVRLPVEATAAPRRTDYGDEPTHRITQPNANAPGHSYTLAVWANEWLRDYNGHIDDSTRNRYEGHIRNHIVPHIGQRTLDQLSTRVLIDEWWNVIQAKRKVVGGVVTDEPLLSDAGLSAVYKTMRLVLKAANAKIGSRMGLVASLIHPPHQTSRPETDREVAAAARHMRELFFEQLNRDDPRWAIYIFSLLGLRQGERLGLSAQSLDLTPGDERLLISKQLSWSENQGIYILKNATKNGDTREIPLWGEFLEAAIMLQSRHNNLSQQRGWDEQNPFDQLLMRPENGEIRDRRSDTKVWKQLVGPGYRGHLARHVTGQLLAERGIGTDVAKVLLGWRSDAYAHYYRTISTAYAGRVLRDQYTLDVSVVQPPERRQLGV